MANLKDNRKAIDGMLPLNGFAIAYWRMRPIVFARESAEGNAAVCHTGETGPAGPGGPSMAIPQGLSGCGPSSLRSVGMTVAVVDGGRTLVDWNHTDGHEVRPYE